MISPTPLKMWMSVFVMATALFLAAYTVQRYFQQHRQHLLVAFAAHMVAILLFQAITFSETVVESPELMLRLINLSTAVFIWLALYTLLWFVLVYSDNEAWVNQWTVGAAGVQILLLATVVTVWPEFLYEVDGVSSEGTVTVFGLTTVEYTALERQLTWRFQAIAAVGIAAHLTAGAILGRYLYNKRAVVSTGHLLTLLVAFLTPSVVVGLTTIQLIPVGAGFTDLGLAITAIAFGTAVFRYRLLNLGSIGRDLTITSMTDPVVIVDTDSRVVDSNPAARLLAGHDTAAGMRLGQFFDQFPSVIEAIHAAGTGHEVAIESGTTEQQFQLQLTPITDRYDEVVGQLIVLRDITQLKSRERTLEHQNDRLEKFASVVSHDLRNPLSIAQGYAELAETTGEPSHFVTLHDAHERMETMIEELLILAQTGNSVDETEPVWLSDHVNKTWKTTDTQTSTLDNTIPETYQLPANPDLLQHIFENLFRNAAEHGSASSQSSSTPENAADHGSNQQTESAGTDPLVVTVGLLTREGSTEGFYVEDNGDGIPSTIREQIFDHGYSGGDGTGFGLSIVHDFVVAHGWQIAVAESDAGGARFEIKLRDNTSTGVQHTRN